MRGLKYLCNHFQIPLGYVETDFLGFSQMGSEVGRFEENSQFGGCIRIGKNSTFDAYTYLAILIHEFMHFLAHTNELDFSSFSTDEIEIMTDIMAIASGYGKPLLIGYMPFSGCKNKNIFGEYDKQVGYLTANEIGYLEQTQVLALNARIL